MKTEIKLWVIAPSESEAMKISRYEPDRAAGACLSEEIARGMLAHVLAHLGNDEQTNAWWRACKIWPVTKAIKVGDPVDVQKAAAPAQK